MTYLHFKNDNKKFGAMIAYQLKNKPAIAGFLFSAINAVLSWRSSL
jgi:hypothetical protein